MARARNIKPGFFKNEDLAECSPWARLCFAGLWVLADRDGRLEDRPKRIKGELFPFDAVEVDPLLDELERFKFIVRYDAGDMRAIQILEFKKHQTPHYSEKPSVIKAPDFLESCEVEEHATPGALQEDSRSDPLMKRLSQPPDSLNPDSLNPEEESVHAHAPPPTPARRKRPKAVEVTLAEWLQAMHETGQKAVPNTDPVFAYAREIGLPAEFLHLAWAEFKARYTSEPVKGQRQKTYTDWRAVFRKAVREGWLKLWYLDGQHYALTAAGQQAQRAAQAEQQREGDPA